jgi:hypothetical protein
MASPLENYSAELPLAQFYAKYGTKLEGVELSDAIFKHIIHNMHNFVHLQLDCKDPVMFLVVFDESAGIQHTLLVGALTVEKVLTDTLDKTKDAGAILLLGKLKEQAAEKCKTGNRALVSLTMHFFKKNNGGVSLYNKMVDPLCRTCQALGTMTCSGCHLAKYCSKKCQDTHWTAGHKNICGKS